MAHADIRAHNTFDVPNAVEPLTIPLDLGGEKLHYTFAPASVTVLKGLLSQA